MLSVVLVSKFDWLYTTYCAQTYSIFYLFFHDFYDEMQQSDPPTNTGLGVSDLVQTADFKAKGISSLSSVHKIPESQHQFQQTF